MASQGLSRVVELHAKVEGLLDKGHVARALEISGRAVDAARALGEAEDSLIVASEELYEAECRDFYARFPNDSSRCGGA